MDIFMYWDNPPGKTAPPPYIQLCWETIHKHCCQDFDIHLVTTENVKQFLPNISDSFFQIAQINNKSNFLRYMLLRERGGIWLDSDLILFKSLKPLLDSLTEDTDLAATASPTLKYGELECGILVSTKGGKIITKAVRLIEYKLGIQPPGHHFKWGSMGPTTIREAAKGKRYNHIDCRLLSPVASWEAFRFSGKGSIDTYCPKDAYGAMLFHAMFQQYNSPFLTMSRQQLLDSPTLLGQMFRRALMN